MSRKQTFIALCAAALAAVVVAGYFVLPRSSAETARAPRNGSGFEVTAADHTLGDPKARLVLIEYAAPICPHCARFEANVFPKLKKNYIDTGKVYFVFRIFPLSPYDGAAEKLARCLPANKYFAFMDMLFRNQPKWDPEYAAQNGALGTPDGVHAAMVQMAGTAGLSADRAEHCMSDPALDTRINAVAIEAQNRYKINSTPSFVLDGQPVAPPYMREWTYEDMAEVLDAALAAKK